MQPILEATYGIITYQEQVMRIAQVLAGFTLAEADVLRKAVGKKDAALIAKELETFVLRAGPTFELLHTNRIGETTLASPALVDGHRHTTSLGAQGSPRGQRRAPRADPTACSPSTRRGACRASSA